MTAPMQIAAKPTLYEGVLFRSRLEATWAAFFDLLKWTWQYEPYDLKYWVPDFLIRDKILVEVKPHIECLDKRLKQKMFGSDKSHPILFLDNGPHWNKDPKLHILGGYNHPALRGEYGSGSWEPVGVAYNKETERWNCYGIDQLETIEDIVQPDQTDIRYYWHEATNRTRWHP